MKRILLFLAYLLIFSSTEVGQTLIFSDLAGFCAEPKNPVLIPQSTPNKTSVPIEQSTSGHSNKTTNNSLFVIQIFAALISGGLAGAIVNIYFTKRQSKKELRSLSLAFASELTLAFVRCVKYYEQSRKPEVSYSGLFDFTDSAILSRFAVVNTQPEIVAAIVDLKSHYFQIRRHVEEASKFAAQANRLAEDEKDKERLMKAAIHAQGTALAFFFSSYEDIVMKTGLILEEAKKISSKKVVGDLEQKFKEAEQKKLEIDKANNKIM
jgi:hypothetical protein